MRQPEPNHHGALERPATEQHRRRVQHLLEAHYLADRLTLDQFEERLGWALAAGTATELEILVADLPPLPREPSGPSAASRPRRRHRRDVRAHLRSYLLVMALLVTIWLLTTPGGFFWPIWPMLGWGIGLASHAFGRGGPAAFLPGPHGRRPC
jgi:hypothetical protein